MARILIIDDDEAVRRMLRFRLKEGHEIADTASPKEGLLMALQDKPDAILVETGKINRLFEIALRA